MRKITLSLLFIFIIIRFNYAQTFTEQTGITLTGVHYGSVAWGDYNNDGYLDILLTGNDASNNEVSKIYKNNGNNTFTEQTGIYLTRVSYSSAAWGDYDNDGDLDILLTGESSSKTSKIYKNNGNNTFTEQTGISLTGVYTSSAVWGDYNNDGDLDILLSGGISSGRITKIYKNTGSNNFTEQSDISFSPVYNGANAWGDYDNDGDLDVILTGTSSSGDISKIYRNNGDNTFTEQTGINISPVNNGSVDWGDYDNDGDLDLLITGSQGTSYYLTNITKIYKNNGNNSFVEQSNISLTSISRGKAKWGDYDNDGDLDILLSGWYGTTSITNSYTTKIYKNNGNNTFTEQTGISLPGVIHCDCSWADYDNDGDLDILLSGHSLTGVITKIYKNNSTTSNTSPSIPSGLSTQIIGDKLKFSWNNSSDNSTPTNAIKYNLRVGTTSSGINVHSPQSNLSNGFRRIVERGLIQENEYYMRLANIPSCGTLYWSVQAIDNTFKGSGFSSTASKSNTLVATASNDTIISVGNSAQLTVNHNACSSVSYSWAPSSSLSNSNIKSPIATPSVSTTYTVTVTEGSTSKVDTVKVDVIAFEDLGNNFIALKESAIDIGDYDNDGDLDFIICGSTSGNYSASTTKIYKNNGNNSFTELGGLSIDGVYKGDVKWGDYDNDGYLDILLSGTDATNNKVTKIYKNNGPSTGSGWTFTEQSSIILSAVYVGSVAWGDYNNDGYQDIIITGIKNSNASTIIYKNNGDNTFTEQTQFNIYALYYSSVDWGDYNNNGYLDILISGYDGSNKITKIYKNTGGNGFVEQTSISLTGIYRGDVKWVDYNNDGLLDISLTGSSASGPISKIYKNNGNNTFAEQTSITIEGVFYSSVNWGDYDNDGDMDFIICGSKSYYNEITKLYKNENNNFIEQTNVTFDGISSGQVLWADFDNDKDLDLIYSGSGISRMYKNNILTVNQKPSTPNNLSSYISGNNIYFNWNNSTDNNTPTVALSYNLMVGSSSNSIDAKSPQSIISSGYHQIVGHGKIQNNTYKMKIPISILACNNIYWSVQAIDNGYLASDFSATSSLSNVLSLNTSNDTTIVIGDSAILNAKNNACGTVSYNWAPSSTLNNSNIKSPIASPTTKTTYYVTITASSQTMVDSVTVDVSVFDEITGTGIANLKYSSADWGDYDNDGDLDLIICGTNNGSSSVPTTNIYKNNGSNSFTELNSANIIGVYMGDVKWGDFNNDGFLDIIITGYPSSGYITKVYINNGNNTFSEQTNISLQGFSHSSIAIGDYNNDGYADIALSGYYHQNFNYYRTIIYKNDGNMSFIQEYSSGFGAYGSLEWGDMDNDGDLDLLATGSGSSYYIASLIFKNNGNGNFSAEFSNLDHVKYGSAKWGDYDGDGDLDILLSGRNSSNQSILKVYKNNGYNNFYEQTGISLQGIYNSKAGWGDYDNDGDLDILFTGLHQSNKITGVYTNLGNNSFSTDYISIGDGVDWGNAIFADFDNDNDLDILVTGNSSVPTTKLFKNKTPTPNTKPMKPTISYVIDNDNINFTWNKAPDNNTPTASITYNLVIGDNTNKIKYLNANSNLQSGIRKLVKRGNMQFDTSYSYDISEYFAGEKFIYRLQAIDNSFIGSEFSDEDTIIISLKIGISRIDTITICPRSYSLDVSNNYDTALTNQLSYQWLPTTGLSNANIKNPIASNVGTTMYHLTVTSSDGLIATDSFEVEITPIPTSTFSLPSTININSIDTISYTGNTASSAVYSWEFDGATIASGSGQGPYYLSWDSTGMKELSLLIVKDGCISDTTFHNVDVAPVASFTLVDSICKLASTQMAFDGIISDSAIYNWDFDGATIISGTNQGPYSLSWNTSEYKTISLQVSDNGVLSDIFTDSIYIKELPNANYSVVTPILITDTSTLTFLGDTSSIISYNWNLDGGNTISGGQNAVKTKWTTTGIKNTSLIVTSDNGCNSIAANNTINVGPTSTFTIDSTACVNSNVLVTYTGTASLSANYNWIWDGGVVISGNGQGPFQVRWNTPGTKNILLTVSENNVSSQGTASVNIEALPTSNFTIADSLCNNSTTTISYTGDANSNSSYSWNFGGATIISGVNRGPYEVKWTTTGSKHVSLSVTENTCVSNQTTNTIYVSPRPIATFNMPLTGTITDTILINYTGSTLNSASYTWNFDNANIISGTNDGPYLLNWDSTGLKTVSLFTTDQNLCSSAIVTSNIHIAPSSLFNTSTQLLSGDHATITYLGGASASAIYNWNFDGGTIISGSAQGPYQVSWATAGVKNISLIVIENGVSSSQTIKQTIVSPTVNINTSNSICVGDTNTISYQGSAASNAVYNWNMPGAQILSGSGKGSLTVKWNSSGKKYISLTVIENGQSAQISDSINILSLPISNFSIIDSLCANIATTISYTGNGSSSDNYYWNFNGGSIVSGSNQGPYQVLWSDSGIYNISLVVNDGVCSSILTHDTITILKSPLSTFSIPNQANATDSITITYTGNAATNSNYNWNFDSGNIITGSGQGPYQIKWINGGVKTVSLDISSANNCSSSTSYDSITILPNSKFYTVSSLNTGDTALITYTGSASSSAVYNWNFDGGILLMGSGQGPYRVKWDSSGVKNLSLSVSENGLTSGIYSLSLTVKPEANFTHSATVCQGDTTIITYLGSAGNGAYYYWNFDGGMVVSGSGQGPLQIYWYADGLKTISLNVVENNVVSDFYSDTIRVNTIFSSNFNATTPIISGDTCVVNYLGNAPINTNYNWNFNNAIQISGSGKGPYQVKWDTSGVKALSLKVSKNSCNSSKTFFAVAVTPNSDFTIDTSVCANSIANVVYSGQASSSALYNWNFDGGIIVSGSGQGPYQIRWISSGVKTVSLTVFENGQTSTITTHTTNVHTLPTILLNQNSSICLYDSILLSATAIGTSPFSYLWSNSDTTTNTTVNPIHDSIFWIQITDSIGCQNYDSTLVNVLEPYNNEEICIVSVDSSINKNRVVWTKTPGVSTDYFKIYKESSIINIYDSIGYVPYDSLSFFIDTASYPDVKSNRYKISVVDSCGNESQMSLHHKTMHLAINKGIGWTFNLIWTTYEGFQVQTYIIWRWTNTNGWNKIDSVSGGVTSYVDSPPNGLTYYAVEIVSPYPCDVSKANTNYNYSRSNTANTSFFNGISENTHDIKFKVFPNPYSNKTNITYQLRIHSEVKLEVFSILGEQVTIITQGNQNPGNYKYQFNAAKYGFGAGIYYLRLSVNNQIATKKIVEVR